MLDTLIVGGGVCGLSLASKLEFAGRDYLLLEARQRLGGRVETVEATASATAADLGPSWFWPATQPLLSRLIVDLGLSSFDQHDDGTVLHLAKADQGPEPLAQNGTETSGVHIGARCISEGVGALVKALVQRLAPERVRLGRVVTKLVARADFVEAHCLAGTASLVIAARRVVLALPPRLVAERIAFEPGLDPALLASLENTPTWMAAQCKVVSRFAKPFWRESGLSGNAFVTHPQAVLGEVFDASGEDGSPAALGGFSALPPSVRIAYKAAHEMMIHSQLAQLFGPAAAEGELHMRDWAQEQFTCSTRDMAEGGGHPQDGVAALASPIWNGMLLLGGSETATQSAGYLEGALDAAGRIWSQLSAPQRQASIALDASRAGLQANQASLAAFTKTVAELRSQALPNYRQGITRALSSQQSEDMTQSAIVETADAVYAKALEHLRELSLDLSAARIENGRCSLTPAILSAFLGFSDTLLKDVQHYNASSCAISNFPLEHSLNQAYLQSIRRDLAALWREFALAVNDSLVDRMEAMSAPV